MSAEPSDLEAVAAYQRSGQDVGWLLRHWATHKPDHPFLIWEPRDGEDRTWSYAQFFAEARGLAAGLAKRGVGKGERVMIHADNCPEMVLAWYACALLGAARSRPAPRRGLAAVVWGDGDPLQVPRVRRAELDELGLRDRRDTALWCCHRQT